MKNWIEHKLAQNCRPANILIEYIRMVGAKIEEEGEERLTWNDCLKMKDINLNIAWKWYKMHY